MYYTHHVPSLMQIYRICKYLSIIKRKREREREREREAWEGVGESIVYMRLVQTAHHVGHTRPRHRDRGRPALLSL